MAVATCDRVTAELVTSSSDGVLLWAALARLLGAFRCATLLTDACDGGDYKSSRECCARHLIIRCLSAVSGTATLAEARDCGGCASTAQLHTSSSPKAGLPPITEVTAVSAEGLASCVESSTHAGGTDAHKQSAQAAATSSAAPPASPSSENHLVGMPTSARGAVRRAIKATTRRRVTSALVVSSSDDVLLWAAMARLLRRAMTAATRRYVTAALATSSSDGVLV